MRFIVAELTQIVIENFVLPVKPWILIFILRLLLVNSKFAINCASLGEVPRQENLMIILRCLSSTDETEERLFLLHINGEDAPTCLEVILKLLVKMQW